MKVLIFAGQSISTLRGISDKFKNFAFLPPLKHADLISSVEYYKPDIIGIIDDYCGQSESVWHNEIIYILEKGIKIFGASGVGAIRAAELERFGMVGIGEIFKFYKSLMTSSDEEIVSLFDEKNNYQRITEPLINIRFTLEKLKNKMEIPEDVFYIIKDIYWKERSKDKIISKLKLNKINEKIIEAIFANYYDVQAEDALLLLENIEKISQSNLSQNYKEPEVIDGNLFEIMYERDRKVKSDNGETNLNNIANYTILNHPQSENLIFEALNREIVAFLAGYLNVEITDEDIKKETERLCSKLKINNLDKWLQDNDINKKTFNDLMKKNALCRRMQAWFIGRRKYRRTTSIINEELILKGEYIKYKEKTIDFEREISEDEVKEKFNKYSLIELVALKIKRSNFPWNVNPIKGAAESGIGKSDFHMLLAKEEVLFEKIREDIEKIFGE